MRKPSKWPDLPRNTFRFIRALWFGPSKNLFFGFRKNLIGPSSRAIQGPTYRGIQYKLVIITGLKLILPEMYLLLEKSKSFSYNLLFYFLFFLISVKNPAIHGPVDAVVTIPTQPVPGCSKAKEMWNKIWLLVKTTSHCLPSSSMGR